MAIKNPKDTYEEKVRKYFNLLMDEKLLDSESVNSIKTTMRVFHKINGDHWVIKTPTPIIIKIPKHEVITEIEIFLNIDVTLKNVTVENEKHEKKLKTITKFNEYLIVINCWTCKEDFYFRKDYDSEQIKPKIKACGKKRVMLRFHFEKRSQNKDPELYYHFHVGGKQGNRENFWLPSQIKEPRFPHPPMDLLLVLEFIIRNYIRTDRINEKIFKLTNDPMWRETIKQSERIFQQQYFEKSLEVLNNDANTLVGYACDYKIQKGN